MRGGGRSEDFALDHPNVDAIFGVAAEAGVPVLIHAGTGGGRCPAAQGRADCVDALTPSELRVARMAAEGLTNREIALSLFVTAKTIETHLRHVYQKLDVPRRTELASALG